MRVLLHYDVGPGLSTELDSMGGHGLDVKACPQGDQQQLLREIEEAHVLWHVLEPVGRAHIERAPDLRLIQKIGVGVNTIDLDTARERGIAVCNMPGTNSRAVMEATLALMLAALRRLPWLDQLTRRGEGWSLQPHVQDAFGELGGRTVGLVGFGAVPSLLAPVLEALGATVVYTAPSARDVPYAFVSLEELLERADVVSLHVPLDETTENLLSAGRIDLLRDGAVVVNTARGGLVDEQALYRALVSGHVRAAGLDVLAVEPADTSNPLFSLPNVVVSPHVAWLTPETLGRSLSVAIENCRRLEAGEPLLHRVV